MSQLNPSTTIAAGTFCFDPASSTSPGVLTTGPQTFGGAMTFSNFVLERELKPPRKIIIGSEDIESIVFVLKTGEINLIQALQDQQSEITELRGKLDHIIAFFELFELKQ